MREWLEQQASTGILEVEEDAAPHARSNAESRRFSLPAGHAEVLIDRDSLNCLAGLLGDRRGRLGASATARRATRPAGVPYPDFGVDTREGIAEMNRPMFLNLLGQAWLPAIPELHARLQANPPARVLNTGCGNGWSSIAIAQAYPNATVHGFDADEASIATARANADAAGLTDRVTFAIRDASRPGMPAASIW